MDEVVSKETVRSESGGFHRETLIGIFFLLVFLSHLALITGFVGEVDAIPVKQLVLMGVSFWAAIGYLFGLGFSRAAAILYLTWRCITFLIGLAMVGPVSGVLIALVVYISMLFVVWRSPAKMGDAARGVSEARLKGVSLLVVIFSCVWVVQTTLAVLMAK
ncbi:hypothetical protein [Microbulbifer guangxiensis]|uniref:hypothetical protein n=1 Tax=Microbulbifer guangxiensis TaxID=2904249 RepID=UPI001F29CB2E|nr:hypothetical protein [Microbulbifer guangxiensis]